MSAFDFFKRKNAKQKAIANAQAKSDLRIIDDCMRILQTTTNRVTFYSRLSIIEEKILHLKEIEPYIKLDGATPTKLLLALQRDKPTMIQEFEARSGGPYFEHLETIKSQWSVLSNLKLFTGDNADAFESLCKQNINEYYEMVAYNESKSSSYVRPPRIPVYVRLAMLYEKQERYDRAIEICVEAIKAGATNDGSKGKMYG